MGDFALTPGEENEIKRSPLRGPHDDVADNPTSVPAPVKADDEAFASDLKGDIVRLKESIDKHGYEKDTFESKDEIKSLFVRWLVVPKQFRWPKTQKQFAEILPISYTHLSRWKNDPEVDRQVKALRVIQLRKYDQKVFDALGRSAMIEGKDGVKDRELYMKVRGYDVDRLKIDAEVNHSHEMKYADDDTLVNIAAEDLAAELMEDTGWDRKRALRVAKRSLNRSLNPAEKDRSDMVEDAEFEVVEDDVPALQGFFQGGEG